jgi:hypothetical protein
MLANEDGARERRQAGRKAVVGFGLVAASDWAVRRWCLRLLGGSVFSAKVRFPSQEFDFDFHSFTHDTPAAPRPAQLVVDSFTHIRE